MKGKQTGKAVCSNWDKPRVQIRKSGVSHPSLRRIVETSGVDYIPCETLIRALIESLRYGNDVRLTDRNGDQCVRFYPMMDADGKMYVACQTLTEGSLRNCLSDKVPSIIRNNREITSSEMKKVAKEQRDRREVMISVTPSTTVECPKCGTIFRVGKQLGVSDGRR